MKLFLSNLQNNCLGARKPTKPLYNNCWIATLVAAFLFVSLITTRAADGKVLFQNDFEKATVGALPDGFLAIDGDFKVIETNGNKALELPGIPAENFYGVLFGSATNSGISLSARVYGTGGKRRAPSFAIGLNGASGYCLRASPAKNTIEIYKGDEMRTNAPLAWKSDTWTMMRLQVRATANQTWMVEGKVWEQGVPEPKDWTIAIEEKTEPTAGRPSLWGTPYSSTPIWYDDLKVTEIAK